MTTACACLRAVPPCCGRYRCGLRRVGKPRAWLPDGWLYFEAAFELSPGALDTHGLIHGFASSSRRSPYVFEGDCAQKRVCRVDCATGEVRCA
jgi:hypothetical protein